MKKLLLLPLILAFIVSNATPIDQSEIERLKSETAATVSLNRATKVPNFIRFPQEAPLELAGNTLSEKAYNFLAVYGDVFGIEDPTTELLYGELKTDFIGFNHLTLEQHYKGVPIFDGKLRFHFNEKDQLTAINGIFLADITISPSPSYTAMEAAILAKSQVALQKQMSTSELFTTKNELLVYHTGLLQGVAGNNHLVYYVEVGGKGIREFVLIDAIKGQLVDQFTGSHSALDRELYENNTGSLTWSEGDAFPGTLDQWQEAEVATSGHMYHMMNNAFGHTSYDGADATMVTINNAPGIGCPNANWSGTAANYCDGTAADDVVAHEWGHAYTEYTANLIYQWQSGALNESYSDIWGETVDLLNAYNDTGENLSPRTNCNNSLKWQIGEDASAFGGAIRDMWSPTCDGDPGKVTDNQYPCGTGDNGGVHTNSGVPNHAYALLVDGGTYNGQTMMGIGFTKAAHIHWRALSFYLTATSDFSVHADALEAACADLMGVNLEGLTTTITPAGPSGEIITAADCADVTKAILAVEFRTPPDCNFQPILAQAPPALCPASDVNVDHFFEDFETDLSQWTITQLPTNPATWDDREWIINTTLPGNRAGAGVFGPDPIIGNCTTDKDNGIIRLESQSIAIPATGTGPIVLTFDHYVAMEDRWDGGNLKYSINGGGWNLIPGTAFTFNGYNKTLNNTAAGNDNPLAGEDSFTGADEGSNTGSWGQSQVSLTALGLGTSDNIRLRWELGVDGCNGIEGWYLDDVSVYTCTENLPIELIDFTAKKIGNQAKLKWNTATEINNAFFEIQHSTDTDIWRPLGLVDGAGNSIEIQRYNFTHPTPKLGTNYYRLKQVDFDGSFTYSEVRTVNFEERSGQELTVYPIPFKNQLTLQFPSLGAAKISLFDVSGRKVMADNYFYQQEIITLDLGNSLAEGVYWLRVQTEDRAYVRKVVKTD